MELCELQAPVVLHKNFGVEESKLQKNGDAGRMTKFVLCQCHATPLYFVKSELLRAARFILLPC